jgi:hypothetical protein
MARLIWAITCQRIIVDNDSNLVTYVDATEEVHVPQMPFPLAFYIGLLWAREAPGESIRMRVSVHDPDGTVTFQREGYLVHPVVIRHRANLPIAFVAQSAGEASVMVEQFVNDDWRVEKIIPIHVDIIEDSPKPEASED